MPSPATRHQQSCAGLADDALVARVAAGDHAAFGALADRHMRTLHGVAYRMLLNRHDAEDVVQETFLRLWRKAGLWRPDGGASVRTWLCRIVCNLCLDRKRKPAFVDLEAVPEPMDRAPSAEAMLHRKKMRAVVARLLAELPERQRAAVALCHYEGMSNAEAASALGVGVKALESLLVRARRTLHQELKALHYLEEK